MPIWSYDAHRSYQISARFSRLLLALFTAPAALTSGSDHERAAPCYGDDRHVGISFARGRRITSRLRSLHALVVNIQIEHATIR
jgi:hypothetical protein